MNGFPWLPGRSISQLSQNLDFCKLVDLGRHMRFELRRACSFVLARILNRAAGGSDVLWKHEKKETK